MVGISAQYIPRLVRDISFDVGTMYLLYLSDIERIFHYYQTSSHIGNIAYWNNMLHMSAQCYEHRFGYCINAKTCFNVHFGAILAERRVLLGPLTH